MAKQLGEFFVDIAKKSGINADDEALKTLLANGDFFKFELPDDLAKNIDTALISMKDAKNNHTDLKNHYTKQALDGLDSTINALLDELGIPEDMRNEIMLERSSYKRPAVLIRKVKELEQKKANADKPDKAAIQKELDGLHAQLRAATDKEKQLESDYAKKEVNLRRQYRLGSMLSGYKTVFDTLDAEVKNTTLQALIDKNLQDNNAQMTFDENGNFVLLKKDGTNFYGDNNQQINAQQYIEQILSRNKALITTQPPPAAGATPPNGQHLTPPAGGNGKPAANATFTDIMKETQNNWNQALKVS